MATEYVAIEYPDFERVDVRAGRIVEAADFPEARKPAYKLRIDFGDGIGIRSSSVQIVANYAREDLVGTLVMGVVNLPPKRIGPFVSECLTLGFPGADGNVVLARPGSEVPLGSRLF
ncbi:MAG: tRNA-binding protein [Armatimonadota bacterium]